MKQAIILAGGKGTRLKDRLKGLPKPMIDLCGKPLLERQILLLKKYGFTDIIILVNYQSDHIINFCKINDNWGINIICINDGKPLGTAGATIKIFDLLNQDFLVMYGDTMLNVDLDKFYEFHLNTKQDSAGTLFLHPNDHPADSDLVEIGADGKIIGFHPYPHNSDNYYNNLVNAALYWLNKSSLENWISNDSYLDFGKDIFPLMLKKKFLLRGYISSEYIKDCGTPSRLDKVCIDFKNGKIDRFHSSFTRNAIFIDRDGTINEEVNHLSDPAFFKLIPDSSKGIKLLNSKEYLTCIVTNQPVIARGDCSLDELSFIHKKMETLLGEEGAYIDRIYYCPHHPDSGFDNEVKKLKINCDCRKPNIGMLTKARLDLNINLNGSWFIGDTTTDILTAKKAGIKSVLVETGMAGLDYKYLVYPDFICSNLHAAAKFITNDYELIYNYCRKLVNSIGDRRIIKICGETKSVKNNFANVLKYYLLNNSYKVHLISLDRWVKKTKNSIKIFEGELKDFIEIIAKKNVGNVKVKVPFYNSLNIHSNKEFEFIEIKNDEIVIIEAEDHLISGSFGNNSINLFVSNNKEINNQKVLKENFQIVSLNKLFSNK